MKKSPKCIYGHSCFSACVNPECSMPAFMCETGSKQFDQCGSFHQKCQRIIWTDIEGVINRNPKKRMEDFQVLQDKIDQMFFNLLKLIQEQHQKFKTWIVTYGHSIEIMKFIKNINEQNYKQIDGKQMDLLMNQLFGNERTVIEAPRIKDSDISKHFQKIQNQINKISDIYLKEYLIAQSGHRQSQTTNTTNKSGGSAKNSRVNNNHIDSNIVSEFSTINEFFDGRIKSLKLLYRASENYFSIKEFHNKCDNIPHTVTLLENEYGKILGGYTPLIWNTGKKNWSPDKEGKSFMFSVTLGEKYKLNLPQFAIANNPERGPIFGCCDLFISQNADKQKSGAQFPISFNNGKYMRKAQTSQTLTGNSKGKFLLKDWQVFQVELYD